MNLVVMSPLMKSGHVPLNGICVVLVAMLGTIEMTPAKPKFALSTGEITHAARKLFSKDEWLILEELFIPGFNRYVDIWAICIGSEKFARLNKYKWTAHRVGFDMYKIHAIEIKATRADFISEMNNPNKRMPAQLFSNYFSFAAPRGIIELEEVPEGLGYIEIQGMKPKIIRKPSYTPAETPGWDFVAAIGRAWKKG